MTIMKKIIETLLIASFTVLSISDISAKSGELVYQDSKGIIRWKSDKTPMGIFGANYCITSSCDFRSVGYVGRDYKSMIDEDLIHFSRMGWQALRLCLWGDWECCDKNGNLIENEHLDALDYLIAKSSEREIAMLFSPIVTYSAGFHEAYDMKFPGLSAHYTKEELITNPNALAAQCNYMTQLLNHVNPYTGRQLKYEPWITFIELINEPAMLIDKPSETIHYINKMVDAIRKTGCQKITYYNVSQDFRVIPILKQTKIQGGSYAWYPTGLNHGYTLKGNILPFVASYPQIKEDIGRRSRLVYEFDTPDVTEGYLYPAMVREYREGGIQFTTMFTYDFLATGRMNLSWQTHHLNMVYTPEKAVSSIISAEAMNKLPIGKDYGEYPENSQFDDFLVDYDRRLSLYNTDKALMYSADILDISPKNPTALKRIVGSGSSTLVKTVGNGIYFLDRISNGMWRMEVHPNIFEVSDPYMNPSITRPSYLVDNQPRQFKLSLPGINGNTVVKRLDGKVVDSRDNKIIVYPGVYIVSDKDFAMVDLPKKVGGIKMDEFVTAKPSMPEKPVLIFKQPQEFIAGKPSTVTCKIYSAEQPESVTMFTGVGLWGSRRITMKQTGYHMYSAEFPVSENPSVQEYRIGITVAGKKYLFPDEISLYPDDIGFDSATSGYKVKIVDTKYSPLNVFSAENDKQLDFSRYYNSVVSIMNTPKFERHTIYDRKSEAAVEIAYDSFVGSLYPGPADISFSKYIVSELKARTNAKVLPIGLNMEASGKCKVKVIFTQSDCRSWSVEVPLTEKMAEHSVSLESLVPDDAAMLPRDFPGVSSYFYPRLNKLGETIDWSKVEKCTVSLRTEGLDNPKENGVLRVKSIELTY